MSHNDLMENNLSDNLIYAPLQIDAMSIGHGSNSTTLLLEVIIIEICMLTSDFDHYRFRIMVKQIVKLHERS